MVIAHMCHAFIYRVNHCVFGSSFVVWYVENRNENDVYTYVSPIRLEVRASINRFFFPMIFFVHDTTINYSRKSYNRCVYYVKIANIFQWPSYQTYKVQNVTHIHAPRDDTTKIKSKYLFDGKKKKMTSINVKRPHIICQTLTENDKMQPHVVGGLACVADEIEIEYRIHVMHFSVQHDEFLSISYTYIYQLSGVESVVCHSFIRMNSMKTNQFFFV